ncbi:hypothetical protein MPL1_05072 [Methylophaga lonarensis MPL]|uniref:Uncharacterized protein n=2 Tax=Methylophaga lonarensis TaxID=999151 RepID=M7NXC9_9GAMM|nr:hypothetical protein MPL1_05072 [Methylophaga lonarensis MPL]
MSVPRQMRLIILLAATVLLMQSLAVWHDAEHSFHDHVAECERLIFVSQQSPLASTPGLVPSIRQALSLLDISLAVSQLQRLISYQYGIRAPPVFS